MYYHIKNKIIKPFNAIKKNLIIYNSKKNWIIFLKNLIALTKAKKLSNGNKIKAIRFYNFYGIKLKNTYAHQYYTSITGQFYENYIPDDIFHSVILPKFNNSLQWPALLDKNLYDRLFVNFSQPKYIIKNINGYFYSNNQLISLNQAISILNNQKEELIIKPSIRSGGGKMINFFKVKKSTTNYKNLKINDLFELYKKDFIIQEILDQCKILKELNPTSLNTLRVLSFFRNNDVVILSTVLRMGGKDSRIDNYGKGGSICGVEDTGYLKSNSYKENGEITNTSPSGLKLDGILIPNFPKVTNMVKALHSKIPYFKIVSWDIALDINDAPVFIEYNTYAQGIDIHQITNGPLFGKFQDEILRSIFLN